MTEPLNFFDLSRDPPLQPWEIAIELRREEVELGATIGVLRRLRGRTNGYQERFGDEGDGWGRDIEGACGEIAGSRATGRAWTMDLSAFRVGGDLAGRVEVRTRSEHWHDLALDLDRDDLTRPYILVTGRVPCFRVRGWIAGVDRIRDLGRWAKFGKNGRDVWAIAAAQLAHMDTFPPLLATVEETP